MILILIIMAIMFFGMCMAMNLFSRYVNLNLEKPFFLCKKFFHFKRARFKERRGIFSNPRLLKVATHNSSSSSSQKQEHLDHKKITNSNRKHHRLRLLHDSKFRNKHHHRNSRHDRTRRHNNGDDCNDSDQQNDEQQKITTIDMDIDMNVLPSDNHHNM